MWRWLRESYVRSFGDAQGFEGDLITASKGEKKDGNGSAEPFFLCWSDQNHHNQLIIENY